MKFSEMPYQRVKLEEVEQKMTDLIQRQKQAADGEQQFAIHQEYYKLMEEVETEITLAMIRQVFDTSYLF